MVSDKDFEDYQNLIQQRFEAMEAQILSLTDTVEKQAALINQLVDGTPTHSVTIINIKGDSNSWCWSPFGN
jgi:predicted DNA-binding ArsR family transcriptional regulator